MESPRPTQIPLIIGVTGHRDLASEEIMRLRETVRRWLEHLRKRFPDSPLQVATSLSPGADLLVAEEALAIGIECIAVLPMPVEQCCSDFNGAHELQRFEQTLSRCQECVVCPLGQHMTLEELDGAGHARTAQYAAAGEIIASSAFILLALWDGKPSHHEAGTARTVEFRLGQRAWFNEGRKPTHQELLPNIPHDVVYHIVTSRLTSTPTSGLEPLQEGYRSRSGGPLESALPRTAELVAARTSELNRELRRHGAAIAQAGVATELIGELVDPPASIVEMTKLFSALDWFATRMRRAVMGRMLLAAVLTILMGVFFLAHSHSDQHPLWRYSILAYFLVFLSLVICNRQIHTGQLHRRFLEARALAEGLRVELFWSIAGVPMAGGTPAAHRRILKQADPGLEWIPNAIRAATLPLFALRHAGIPGGLEFALRKWIGSHTESGSQSEQLRYFRRTGRRNAVFVFWAERARVGTIIVGLSVTAILIAELVTSNDTHRIVLLFLVGLFPLGASVIETYIQNTAKRELRRQYDYMYDVFRSARDRLLQANSDNERRTILALLGHAALSEHAEWLFLHRDRPIDRNRMQ